MYVLLARHTHRVIGDPSDHLMPLAVILQDLRESHLELDRRFGATLGLAVHEPQAYPKLLTSQEALEIILRELRMLMVRSEEGDHG